MLFPLLHVPVQAVGKEYTDNISYKSHTAEGDRNSQATLAG